MPRSATSGSLYLNRRKSLSVKTTDLF
ncbi:hypothetical protein LINGRAHAP2_LOCUS7085 [Linum grandiflorum]